MKTNFLSWILVGKPAYADSSVYDLEGPTQAASVFSIL